MNGLWRWKPGPPKLYPMPDRGPANLRADRKRRRRNLDRQHSGITKLKNGKAEAYPLPAGLQFNPTVCFGIANGGLWIGAVVDSGLLHIHEGRTDLFDRSRRSVRRVRFRSFRGSGRQYLGRDRGWPRPLSRLRRPDDFCPARFVQPTALGSVLAARDGSLWLGTSDGLNRWNEGQITVYRKRSVAWRARRRPGQRTSRGKGGGFEADGSGDYRQRIAG